MGLIVAECTDTAPWLAKKLVRWSARLHYLDGTRAAMRAEELEAVIESRPGKLFKLVTALLFTLQAGMSWTRRAVHWWLLAREIRKGSASTPTRSEQTTAEPSHLQTDNAPSNQAAAAASPPRPRRRPDARLAGMVLPELQKMATDLGITGTGRMRKSQLIVAIQEKQGIEVPTDRATPWGANRPTR
ncbi:Rho termination factor N-terminal domain-containing protein [Microbispora bryophytorum]|uniref:Rho termination factor N-terminal domain-containing protein n=1 Tax=Microbispora bryophytorum TaxID=1460882 RepID=UPI0027E4CA3A|nr:Rho termination factor N-terminal domain-containing protein [Microbispora bryophytorum]